MSLPGVVETFMRNWMEKDQRIAGFSYYATQLFELNSKIRAHLYGQFSIQFSFCMPKKKVLIGFP